MTDFASLDPETRAVALVGSFLQHWAIMEGAMRSAIEKALNLDSLQGTVVCANISLRDKINLLKTLVNMAFLPDEEGRARAIKLLEGIAGMSANRNMIAHDMFFAKEGGVSFFVTKAKGKLSFPTVIWTEDDFQAEYAKLRVATAELDRLQHQLSNAELVKALMISRNRQPTNALFSLAYPPPQDLPLQGLLGFPLPQSNPGKDAQTPEDPRE